MAREKRLELVITGDARKAQKALNDLDAAAGKSQKAEEKVGFAMALVQTEYLAADRLAILVAASLKQRGSAAAGFHMGVRPARLGTLLPQFPVHRRLFPITAPRRAGPIIIAFSARRPPCPWRG